MTAWKMLAALGVAEFFGMTLWFSATAVTPVLVDEFRMAPDRAAWLTMAVQAGFVAGTLVSAIANLADVLNARVLLFLGALAGALANAGVLWAPSGEAVIGLRFLTGASLALVYPPGMKLAAGWFRDRRGLALGVIIGALTLGKAFPHLLTALYGSAWREPMLIASALAVIGGLLVLVVVRDGPYVAATAPFDPHAVRRIFQSRGARMATFGYLGHMWELYAMWTWIAVLATASFAASGLADAAATGSIAAFVAIGSGTAGCVVAGWLGDRFGRAETAMSALAVSAMCAALTVVVFGTSPVWFFVLAVVWGFAVVADSAQFSALISEHAPREHVGTALTLQTCLGFLLTIVTIEALPRVAEAVGWRWASWLLVPGPVLGIWAMRGFLRPDRKI
ncbi:MAG TPA: MFS transporter [Vicinamibacterales bacterium]|nr:MFS transporter [Vicinamibacterales bacterium]